MPSILKCLKFMGKAPLILKYLHDHARLVCDRRNENDGPGKWRITAIPDDHRKNIIYHFGSAENCEEFFSNKIQPRPLVKVVESPTLNYCEVNLKSLERREMMRMAGKGKKVTKDSRITLKRNTQEQRPKTGIFSNGIHSNNRVLIPEQPNAHITDERTFINNPVFDQLSIPSTSSIYLASHDSSDYEGDLFNEPDDISLAQYHHQQDLFSNSDNYGGQEDWFDNTANFTQSQRSSKHPTGFVPSHGDYYRFNSQR